MSFSSEDTQTFNVDAQLFDWMRLVFRVYISVTQFA